jgi:fumarate hydratase class II
LWPTHGPGPADRSPHAITGYDEASVISPYAIEHDLTLKEAALANGVSEEVFDRVVDPLALTRGGG